MYEHTKEKNKRLILPGRDRSHRTAPATGRPDGTADILCPYDRDERQPWPYLENRRTNGEGLTVAVLHVAQSAQKHHDNRHHICSTARNAVIFQADARSVLKQEGQHRCSLNEPTIHAYAGQETLPRKFRSEKLNEEDLCTSYARTYEIHAQRYPLGTVQGVGVLPFQRREYRRGDPEVRPRQRRIVEENILQDRPEPGERRRWKYQVPSADQIIPPQRGGAFQDNGGNSRATPAGA
ncbi:hypothetical protein B0H13DRAFT_1906000 [Mycena leptocephala]|nr:hypothetical protein B0H13DRAFT_1906000 [Mycena leptocephala]